MKRKQKIFITGATGFIGKHLVRKLIKQNYKIILFVRKTSNIKPFTNLNSKSKTKSKINIKYGNLTDKQSLTTAISKSKPDIVIHLAGVIHPTAVDDSFYYNNNVHATRHIAEICVKKKVKQMIYCSSVTCYGKVHDESIPIKEDYKCYGQNIYGKTKYLAELEVQKVCENQNTQTKTKTQYTIIRPARVYGPEDYTLIPLFKLVKKRLFFSVGRGLSYMQPIYVDDLADLFISCMLNKKAYSQTYNAAGEDAITKKRFISMIAKNLNIKPNKLYVPQNIALFGARIIETIFKLFIKKEPLVSRKKLKFFIMSRKYNIDKAKQELNFKPKYDIQKGLDNMMTWCKENNLL
tara:strand:+ start:751 stop:1800 length:1050 start_codon:yes stop_codon:yes gene_type:complete